MMGFRLLTEPASLKRFNRLPIFAYSIRFRLLTEPASLKLAYRSGESPLLALSFRLLTEPASLKQKQPRHNGGDGRWFPAPHRAGLIEATPIRGC